VRWARVKLAPKRLALVRLAPETLADPDAGDFDSGNVKAAASFYLQFTIPYDGKLWVRLSLRAVNALAYGDLSDEWGFSDLWGWLVLQSYVWVTTLPDLPAWDYMGSTSPGWWGWPGQIQDTKVISGDGAPSWYRSLFDPGTDHDYSFFSDQNYIAGTTILLTCGVWQYQHLWINDFTCSSTVDSNWLVNGVGLSVLPPGF
jgi:hypothetical protein